MDNYDVVEIVEKIIGETRPIGDSIEDHKRKLNQREFIMLIDCLTDMLIDNARYVNRNEGSIHIIGQEAMDAIIELNKKLTDYIE